MHLQHWWHFEWKRRNLTRKPAGFQGSRPFNCKAVIMAAIHKRTHRLQAFCGILNLFPKLNSVTLSKWSYSFQVSRLQNFNSYLFFKLQTILVTIPHKIIWMSNWLFNIQNRIQYCLSPPAFPTLPRALSNHLNSQESLCILLFLFHLHMQSTTQLYL